MMRLPGLDPRFVAQFAPRALAPRSAPGLAVDLGDEDLAALADDTFAAAMREPTGRAPDSVTVQRIGPEDVTPAARGYADIPGARFERPGAPTLAFDDVPASSPDVPGDTMAFDDEGALITPPAFDVPDAYAFDGTQEPPAVAAEPPPPIAPAAMAPGGTIPAPTTPTGAPAPVAAPSGSAVPGLAAAAPVAPSVAVPGLHGLWDPAQVAPGQTPPGVAPRAVDPTPGPEQAKAASTYRGPAFLTAQEKEQLATAEQRDRRMRIAQGALGGLGGLVGLIGAARGTGAAEFGTGLMSAAGAIPAGAATARVNERIGERRALELANLQREDAAAAAAATSARQAEELALRRRAVEAQAARDEAAAAADQADAAEAAAERARVEGSVAGFREAVRARIQAIPTTNPSRGALLALTEPGGALDRMGDFDSLERVLGDAERVDIRRGGQGAGGSGGSGRVESLTFDAAGNPVVVRSGGGGGGARPAARGGGSPAPSAPTPPAPGVGEDVRSQAMALGVDGYLDDMAWVLQAQDLDPGSEEYRRGMRQFTNRLLDPDVAVRRAAIDDVNAQIAQVRRTAPGGGIALPPELEPQLREFTSARGPAALDRAASAGHALADQLEAMRARDPQSFRLAILAAQNPDVPLPPAAQRMRAVIGRMLSARLHELSGAAVSVPEFARIANSMGVGGAFAWTGTEDQLIRELRSGAELADRQFDEAARQYDERIVRHYVERATRGGD